MADKGPNDEQGDGCPGGGVAQVGVAEAHRLMRAAFSPPRGVEPADVVPRGSVFLLLVQEIFLVAAAKRVCKGRV